MAVSEQQMNAELRERFIRLATALSGKDVSISMYERTETKGKMVAMNADGSHFIVEGLETPLGVLPRAVIRSQDTLAIRAKWDQLNQPGFN